MYLLKGTRLFASRIQETYRTLGQRYGAMLAAPTKTQAQLMLFLLGVALLTGGLELGAAAQRQSGKIHYNAERLTEAVNAMLLYLEGSFGALVMVAAGVGAILSSAFGQYRAALGLMVVSIGAFILRSIMSTFFNDEGIMD